ncbi:mediator of RNA polymerase II transcription subunit 22b-like [Mangifera indica]|uniref:mediator of RNA polymerase II transcription subunit 22b-like n=1 Tax=Mangifera indica TaxID=29780 RepID=UPI001CF9FC42|nr:mediator of RNA polymerase II transcription subunit 22b-like [Mangifera indica]
MNKGGSGPTAAQKQKTLMQRVETDIANIVDNFSQLVNAARVNDPPVRNSQEAFMMEMRAFRMVQAADSLLKLVSELKQTAIFSGFASLNDYVERRTNEFNQPAEKTDRIMLELEKRQRLVSRSSKHIIILLPREAKFRHYELVTWEM